MSQHLPPAFGPLELEDLAPGAQASAREHLGACTSCAQVFAQGEEALAQVGLSLAPVTPPPAVWDRITHRLDEAAALALLVPGAAALLELPEEAARNVLACVGSASGWLDGPAPGCWYQEVDKGERLHAALAALVKLAPGASFPDHRHLGRERALVLQGAYRSRSGRCAAGEVHEQDEGTNHELTAEGAGEVYYLAVVEGGVEVAGQVLRPAR